MDNDPEVKKRTDPKTVPGEPAQPGAKEEEAGQDDFPSSNSRTRAAEAAFRRLGGEISVGPEFFEPLPEEKLAGWE